MRRAMVDKYVGAANLPTSIKSGCTENARRLGQH